MSSPNFCISSEFFREKSFTVQLFTEGVVFTEIFQKTVICNSVFSTLCCDHETISFSYRNVFVKSTFSSTKIPWNQLFMNKSDGELTKWERVNFLSTHNSISLNFTKPERSIAILSQILFYNTFSGSKSMPIKSWMSKQRNIIHILPIRLQFFVNVLWSKSKSGWWIHWWKS